MATNKKISVLFFGTPDFACPSLQQLATSNAIEVKAVVTQTSKPKGRGQVEQESEIFNLAHSLGIKSVLKPKKLNLKNISEQDNDAIALGKLLSTESIDFGIVVAYGKIIPESMLSVPRWGFLNVHPSSLPLWRGAAPLQHTILSGAESTSVCIMKLVKELDAGPIYTSQKVDNIGKLNTLELHDICSKIGGELLLKTIIQISENNIIPVPQPESEITYAHKWTKGDCKINFTEPPDRTFNRIRACAPRPGAFCRFDDTIIKIFSSALHTVRNSLQVGQLMLFQDDKSQAVLGVALSNDHILEIETVQLEGKVKIRSADLLNTKNLKERLKKGEAIFLTPA